jgi:hypothetical protein
MKSTKEMIDALRNRIKQVTHILSILEDANIEHSYFDSTIHNYEVIKEELQTFLNWSMQKEGNK